MSKLPVWLPPERGISDYRLPVFRVQGYPPDAPETFLLLEAFSGSVKQFYLGQARNYSLGSAPQMAKAVDRGDHQIRYQASGGTEIVTLKVHPERAKQILSPEEGWWDSALVEIVLTSSPPYTTPLNNTLYNAFGIFSGFMVAPLLEEIQPLSQLPISGVAVDDEAWERDGAAHPNRILAFPDIDIRPLERNRGDRSTQSGSLRIDLRPFRGMTMVRVELWGVVWPTSESRINDSSYVARYGFDAATGQNPGPGTPIIAANSALAMESALEWFPEYASVTQRVPAFGNEGFESNTIYWYVPNVGFPHGPMSESKWNDGYWRGATPEDWLAAYPARNTVTEWVPGVPKTVRSGGCTFDALGVVWNNSSPGTPPPYLSAPGAGGGQSNESLREYNVTGHDFTDLYRPEFGTVKTPEPRPATVRGACFLGMPFDVWSMYTTSGLEWYQWEISQVYPTRPSLGVLGEVTLQSNEDYDLTDPFNHFRLEKIGTISIDPRRPRGGISFKPA